MPRIGGQGAERAHDIHAEVLEEASILGGERRLDHHVGNFVERHRVVAQQAALADLVAVAVEEGDAVFVGEVHLALSGLEGRQREGGEHQQPAHAQGHPFAGKLVERADDALDLETAEKGRVAGPPVAEADPRGVQAGIDPGIDLQPIDQLGPAITLKEIPHFAPTSRVQIRRGRLASPNRPLHGFQSRKLHRDCGVL